MSKVRVYDVDPDERYRLVGELLDVVSQLKSKKDTVDFIIGLLTPSETLMIARRLQIAKGILGDQTYEQIRTHLGVSYDTISKTEKWLHRGDEKRQETVRSYLLAGPKVGSKAKSRYVKKSILDNYAHHRVLKELLHEIMN